MAKVESWMNRFLARHTDRCRRADWPPLGAEFWEVWRRAFVKHGVTESVADEASFAVALAPPQFLDRHLEAVLEAARLVWAASEVRPDAPGDRDAARAQSRGCPECGGDGLAVRYRRLSAGAVGPNGKPVKPNATLFCVCPMGRWARAAHQNGSPEAREGAGRFLDLADHPSLQGEPGRHFRLPPAPDGRDAPATIPDGATAFDAWAAVRALVRAHAAERQLPRRDLAEVHLSPEEQSFAGRLTAPEAAAFRRLSPPHRGAVMRAHPDPILLAEADRLLGRQRSREVD